MSSTERRFDDRTVKAFSGIFFHVPEYRIVVCRECKTAVAPSNIRGHLKDKHSLVKPAQRTAIYNYAATLRPLAHRFEDVVHPSYNGPVLPWLAVQRDAYRCLLAPCEGPSRGACGWICLTSKALNQHQRERHGVSVTIKLDCPRFERVFCQRFFEWAQWSRYFAVIEPSSQPTPMAGDLAAAFEAAMNEGAAATRREEVVSQATNSVQANPWLGLTGWVGHLSGLSFVKLRSFVQPAADEEGVKPPDWEDTIGLEAIELRNDVVDHGLGVACAANRRVMRTAFDLCRNKAFDVAAMEYVNQREAGGSDERSRRPFYGGQNANTLARYTAVWQRILRYLWRTFELEGEHAPRYRLQPAQVTTLHRIMRICRSGETYGSPNGQQRLDDAILDFWICMLDHPIGDSTWDSGIVSGLAVIGSQGGGGVWMDAQLFTPVCSAVITVARALVLYKGWWMRQSELLNFKRAGWDELEAAQRASSVYSHVSEMVDRFMLTMRPGTDPTPIHRVANWRAYGYKIVNSTKGRGRVNWMQNEGGASQQVNIDKTTFSVGGLRSLVHGLELAVRKTLLQLLLFDHDEIQAADNPCVKAASGHPDDFLGAFAASHPGKLPRVDLSRLKDNPADDSPDYSFLVSPLNRDAFELDGRHWLMRRVLQPGGPQWLRLVAGTRPPGHGDNVVHSIEWKEDAVLTWLDQYKCFKEQLLVLVHLTAGAPARGPELLSIQHRNDDRGAVSRGILFEEGLVCFTTAYHKNYRHSQREKVIFRFVPRSVSEIVVYFLWLVLPFAEQLQTSFQRLPVGKKRSNFLWQPNDAVLGLPDDDEDEDEDADENDEDHEEYVEDEEAQTQFAVDANDGERVKLLKSALAKACCRPEETLVNVDGYWSTDRATKSLARESTLRLGQRITMSQWRQIYPVLHRMLLADCAGSSDVLVSLDALYNGKRRPDGIEHVRARQAAHELATEEMVYGIGPTESPFSGRSAVKQFRQVSVDWHACLGYSHPARVAEVVDLQERLHRQQLETLRRTRTALARIDLDERLCELYGPQARFRSMQRPTLEAVQASKRLVLSVMATGAGKSMTFLLPASMPDTGLTVLVVPLVALRADLAARCDKMGISHVVWCGAQTKMHYSARVVLVTPESADTQPFHNFIHGLRVRGLLGRLVVDECHTVLESSVEWRPAMAKVLQLAPWFPQTICLTATLPPGRDEETLIESMRARPDEVAIFRDSTARRNIHYRVLRYEAASKEMERSTAMKVAKEGREGGIALIYCQRVAEAELLGKEHGCGVYHAQMGKQDVKDAALKRLRAGKPAVWAVTSALGLGVDVPRVNVVVHVRPPKSMVEYAQESGRAGREGQSARAVILLPYKGANVKFFWDELGKQMQTLLAKSGCRRKAIDEVMDGTTRVEGCDSKAGEVLCDTCELEQEEEDALLSSTSTVQGEVEELRVSRENETTRKRTRREPSSEYEDRLPAQEKEQGKQRPPLREIQRQVQARPAVDAAPEEIVKRLPGVITPSMPLSVGAGKRDKKSNKKMKNKDDDKAVSVAAQKQLYHQWRDSALRVNKAMEMGRLNDLLALWTLGCPVCRVLNRQVDTWSGAAFCAKHTTDGSKKKHEQLAMRIRPTRLAAYSACFICWRPQSDCPRGSPACIRHVGQVRACTGLAAILGFIPWEVVSECIRRVPCIWREGPAPNDTEEAIAQLGRMAKVERVQYALMHWIITAFTVDESSSHKLIQGNGN